MKIFVTAKPKKKKEFVEQTDGSHYIVSVKEPAQQGKANRAIAEALSIYFGVPESQINLTAGQTGRQKIFEVPDHLDNFEPKNKQRNMGF